MEEENRPAFARRPPRQEDRGGADSAAPSALDELKRLLRAEEGMEPGNPGVHVGYGHRLPLDLDAAEALLDVAARRALADAEAVLEPAAWASLSRARRVVLASMAYQLGRAGLRAFDDFLPAVRAGDWAKAADEMLNSKWAREDSPARARRLAAAMRGAAR